MEFSIEILDRNSWTSQIENILLSALCNHIDDVVLLYQLMAAKAYVASLAESSFNINFQAILYSRSHIIFSSHLIFLNNKFSNLSAAYLKILKLFQIVLTLLGFIA